MKIKQPKLKFSFWFSIGSSLSTLFCGDKYVAFLFVAVAVIVYAMPGINEDA